MKCPNCGASLNNNSNFCTKCGNRIENNTKVNNAGNSSAVSDIVNTLLSKPKLIILILIVLVVAGVIFSGFGGSSDSGYSKNGGYDMDVFGLSFHIPEGFEESYHSGPFNDGETVDFKSDDYDDLEIDVSTDRSLNLNSNYITAKLTKTIAGKEGTVAFYDSNRVSFYYFEGDCRVKLNTNSPEYEELFASVIN